MRKLPLLLLLASSTLQAVAPVSQKLGNVDVSVEEGSLAELCLRAMREEYTEEWLISYAENPMLFAEAYSPLLSSVLPLGNVLIGEERTGNIPVLDMDTGLLLSLSLRNGRLLAVSTLYLPEGLLEVEDSEEESLPEEEEAYADADAETEEVVLTSTDLGVPYLYSLRFPEGS